MKWTIRKLEETTAFRATIITNEDDKECYIKAIKICHYLIGGPSLHAVCIFMREPEDQKIISAGNAIDREYAMEQLGKYLEIIKASCLKEDYEAEALFAYTLIESIVENLIKERTKIDEMLIESDQVIKGRLLLGQDILRFIGSALKNK